MTKSKPKYKKKKKKLYDHKIANCKMFPIVDRTGNYITAPSIFEGDEREDERPEFQMPIWRGER